MARPLNYFHNASSSLHKLGTDPASERMDFETHLRTAPDDKELNVGASVTDDGRYLVLQSVRARSPRQATYFINLDASHRPQKPPR